MSVYAEGDIIRTTRTHRVVGVTKNGYVRTEDVKGLGRFGFRPGSADNGSLRVEMVKRANRKPQVGDVIDGRRLKATMWKRGTVLRDLRDLNRTGSAHRSFYVLNADGLWYSTEYGDLLEFDACQDDGKLEVVFLP